MGCTGCIIIGEEEMKENKIIWKNMVSGSQEKFDIEKMNDFLRNKIVN
jgi:histidyl-tRNA synthetase